MARETSAAASQSPTFAVFIDTTLDTHLAVLASSFDTVGDLKRKIRAEHVLCFPNIGEIVVQSMKVRRRGSFYHLSDSMLIKSAFDGTKGTWFLYMDVISASHQVETGQNEINQNGGQLQKLQLDKELNVRTIGGAATRVQGLLMNGSSDGNNLIPKDTGCVLKKQPLIDTGMEMLSASDNSSLQHAGGRDDHFFLDEENVPNPMTLNVKDLHDGCNEKKLASDMPVVEEPIYDEVGGLLKDEGPLRNKSKCKKRKNDPPEDPIANVGSCAHSKEALLLETGHHVTSSQVKHKNDPVSPQKLYIEQLHSHSPLKDLTKDEKKKKKKRRKVASGFVDNIAPAITETGSPDTSLDKGGAFVSLVEQVPEENPIQVFINNNQNSDEESDEKLLTDKATRNVTNADYVESGTGRPLSTNLNLDTLFQSRFSYHQSCNDYPIQEQMTSAEPEGQLDGKHTCLGKEVVQVTALCGKPAEVDSEVPTISQFIKKKSKSGSSRKVSTNQNSLHSSAGHAAIESLEEASGNQNTELNKKSDLVNSVEEAVVHRNSVDDSGVPCDANVRVATPSSREKSKKTDLGPSHTFKALNLSGDPVTEDNSKGRSDDHHKDPIEENKDSTVIGEAANLGNLIEHDSVIPSNPKVRSTHHRKKKSSKTELLHNGNINKESIHSLAKEVSGENLKEMFNSHEEEGTECKGPILAEEAAVPGNLSMENSTDPDNRNDKNSRHRRKKSAKAELSNHVSIDKEPLKEAIDKNTKGTALDSHKELHEISNRHEEEGTECKGPLLEDEAAVPGNLSVEISTDPGNPNDRNSQRRRKKSAKAELTNHRFIDKKPVREATDRSTKETSKDNHRELQEEDKTTSSHGEVITIENPAESNPAIPLGTKARSSVHHKRKRDKTENFEKSLGIAQVDHGNEFATGSNPDGMIHDLVSKKNIDIYTTGLPDESSDKHDIVCHFAQTVTEENTEGLLANTNENSDKKADHNVIERRSEAPIEENNMELRKCDTETINFIELFVPKIPQLESHASAQELSSIETGARNKEKLKRKRRSKMHSVDSTADLIDQPSLHEQDKPKKKHRDSDPVSHSLADPSVQLIGKEPKSARKGNEETRRPKSDLPLGDNSSELRAIRNSLDKKKLEKKPQIDTSDIYHNVPVSKVEQTKHLKGNSAISERKLDHISCNKDENITEPTHGNQLPMNFDNSVNSIAGGKADSPNHFSASPDISLKEGIADLAASSDSTEEETPSRQYRVAVRKVPHSKNRKILSDTNPQKDMLASTGTIFNDAVSGSSDDEFRIYDRKATSRALSDTSSTSASSEGDLEETQKMTSFKSHADTKTQEADSAIHGKPDEQNDGTVLSQSSSMAKKSKRMSDIFRSSSSFRKAKLTASQSQMEDSEGQPVDVVLETQPEHV